MKGGGSAFDPQRMLMEHSKFIENQKAEKLRQNFIELQSKLYEKATAYTNLILLGGYAGAFTIWHLTKDQLPSKASIVIAILLAVSLATFALYEVFNMLATQIHFGRVSNILNHDYPPDVFLEKFSEFKTLIGKKSLSQIPIWITCVAVCVITVLAALGLLFYNFLAVLLKLPGWPC